MKNIFLFTILFSLSSSISLADENSVTSYSCRVILAASDVELEKGIWDFTVRSVGESHGGDSQTFTSGDHQIDASADGHWLTLVWTKAGHVIARGLTAMRPEDFAETRVMILYAPDDSEDQVAISCEANH